MNLKQVLAIAVISTMGMGAAQSDELRMRSVGDEPAGYDKPAPGVTMTSVSQKYGEPVSKLDPVGKPPITRWIYNDFTVYFEHNRVIQAVINRKKK